MKTFCGALALCGALTVCVYPQVRPKPEARPPLPPPPVVTTDFVLRQVNRLFTLQARTRATNRVVLYRAPSPNGPWKALRIYPPEKLVFYQTLVGDGETAFYRIVHLPL